MIIKTMEREIGREREEIERKTNVYAPDFFFFFQIVLACRMEGKNGSKMLKVARDGHMYR